MADYKDVVEMLGENPASFLELSKKLLIDWKVKPKQLFHCLSNLRKVDFIGLIEDTHEIKEKIERKHFDVWRIINLGTYKNFKRLCKAIRKDGFEINYTVNEIFKKNVLKISDIGKEIRLANVSVADLGFKDGASYCDICSKAKEFGLTLCPNEIGLQLRLQYKFQPDNEWLYIAMEPISIGFAKEYIFEVGHAKGRKWLYSGSNYGKPGSFFTADTKFIFCFVE